MTDVYAGYGKALRTVNLARSLKKQTPIESAYCNAHSRRYFFKALKRYPESGFCLDHYHEIYQLEVLCKGKPPDQIMEIRLQMATRFEAMKQKAREEFDRYPNGLKYKTALNYFIEIMTDLLYF